MRQIDPPKRKNHLDLWRAELRAQKSWEKPRKRLRLDDERSQARERPPITLPKLSILSGE
jgi:hypothetical protein